MMVRQTANTNDVTRELGAAAIGGRLRRLSERIDEDCSRIYAENGIDFEQRWLGFIHVLASEGPQAVGKLAVSLGISHASISETRQSLQKAGLIISETDRRDARSVQLSLSPAGRRLFARISPIVDILKRISVETNEEAGQPLAAIERLECAMNRMSLYDRYQIMKQMRNKQSADTPEMRRKNR
jgi:DNA-binding MarR family transcriptional regulator